ncbi:ATPASE [Salix viminalis]|uniref:ATPASE n=1 Tax=Salix viminalis TaxID=40686 RepID=A0A9Q0SFT6_SALVM|nr:ATPASE [Salix viminalis]
MSTADIPEETIRNILDQDTLKWVFVGGKGGVAMCFNNDLQRLPLWLMGSAIYMPWRWILMLRNDDIGGNDGMDSLFSELSNAIPGIDEAMSFAEMLKLVQTMGYSCIVFDTAPTGHTLRLLQLPSALEKGLQKLMSLKSKFGGLISQGIDYFQCFLSCLPP